MARSPSRADREPVQRVAVRISRFEDQAAFRRVLDLLTELYPERDPAEFEVGLARLPCLVSEAAELAAARALRDVLEGMGAAVALLRAESAEPAPPVAAKPETSRTMALSPEIDAAFLQRAAAQRKARSTALGQPSERKQSARAEVDQQSSGPADWNADKAPWER